MRLILFHACLSVVAFAAGTESSSELRRPGRLVVHVGPLKTGSTSMQSLLVKEHKWLSDTFDIHVGAVHSPKHGAFLAHTLMKRHGGAHDPKHVNEEKANKIVVDIQLALDANATVIVSSEVFEGAGQEVFQSLIDTANADRTTFVHVHRDMVDRWRSYWEQFMKRSSNPSTFLQFLTEETEQFMKVLSHGAFGIINTLAAVAAANSRGDVRIVAIEMPEQQATLICEVALGLAGAALQTCRSSVVAAAPSHANVSPPPTAIDTVRLARHLATILGCKPLTGLNALNEKVQAVATQLPCTCDGIPANGSPKTPLSELAFALDTAWLARVGSDVPPVHSTKPIICVVDEQKLESPHWSAIKTLLDGCPP